ncbi:hypothetical protein HK096_010176, partial [Nowakowskiella sp. JEL0078]
MAVPITWVAIHPTAVPCGKDSVRSLSPSELPMWLCDQLIGSHYLEAKSSFEDLRSYEFNSSCNMTPEHTGIWTAWFYVIISSLSCILGTSVVFLDRSSNSKVGLSTSFMSAALSVAAGTM